MTSYFADTYALIKWSEANSAYRGYIENSEKVLTSLFNLYEFYYYLLRKYGKEAAEEGFYYFEKALENIKFEDIFLASRIKIQYAKKKLSYADCLGYAMALNRKIRFLTGDSAFEHIENVEYIRLEK